VTGLRVRDLPGRRMLVTQPVVGLYARPHPVDPGGPERELLLGEAADIIETAFETDPLPWVRVRAERDGYEGWTHAMVFAEPGAEPTHVVRVRETVLAPEPHAKTGPGPLWLSFGSRLTLSGQSDDGRWVETSMGGEHALPMWVPLSHLRAADEPETDPVAVARRFLGTPYVWGGNSGRGLDCSGLVQGALLACGIACPGDSGPQASAFTEPGHEGPFVAGELLFWKGHVAMATGPDMMIHANAHHMSVVEEPIGPALDRIAAQGDAPWVGRGRPR